MLVLRTLTSLDVLAVSAVVLALGAWGLAFSRGTGRWFLFRLVTALFLLLAAWDPVWESRARVDRLPVAVVWDASASMAQTDEAGGAPQTRWRSALDAFEKARAPLEKNNAVRTFTVGAKLKPAAWGELRKMTPREALSDASLCEGLAREAPESRAVVLISDGRWGGGREPLQALGRLRAPVFALGAGGPARAPDLILDGLSAPRLAFKNTDVEVGVKIVCRGFHPGAVPVTLEAGGQTVASRLVTLSTAGETTEALLSFRPRRTGLARCTARVPVFAQEANTLNNRRDFNLDVARDRIRVLYICGRPGPNYAYLRNQLKTNPTVELVTFVIMRDPQDALNLPDRELSLIPFPTQDALFAQLNTFDMLIFEEFNFSQFGIGREGLEIIRRYVEGGGGLLLMATPFYWTSAGPYADTPLEDLLPLDLRAPSVQGPEKAALSVYAADHPLLSLADNPDESVMEWGRLEPVAGGLFAGKIKRGARLLAGFDINGEKRPLAAVWARGKGRVMSLATLGTWRWALGESGRGRGPWVYQRFWNNVLRWLGSSEDFRLVRLDVSPEKAAVGEDVQLRVLVRDESHRPLGTAEVKGWAVTPAQEREPLVFRSVGNGEYAGEYTPQQRGTTLVTAQAVNRQKRLGQDTRAVEAGLMWDETRDTSTDFAALERLSEATGGEFVPLSSFSYSWLREKLDPLRWTVGKRRALGRGAAVLAVLVLWLLAEWALRRKAGEL